MENGKQVGDGCAGVAGDGLDERLAPAADALDDELVAHLSAKGLTVAADRLERYAGLAEGQRRLSDDIREAGMLFALGLSYEGIPFTDLTCEDAVALAAIMAMRARNQRNEDAMPRLILPQGVH